MESSTSETAKGLEEVGVSGEEASKGLSTVGASGEEASKGLSTVGQSGKEASEGLGSIGSASGETASGINEVGTASEKTKAQVDELGGKGEKAGGSFGAMAMGALQAVQQIAQFAQMAGTAVAAIGAIADAANSTIGAFDHLTQDTQTTDKMLGELQQTAASKDFGAQNVNDVAQHMLMMGKNAKDVIPEITKVADTIAGMGGDAKQLQPAIDGLEKIRTSSRVTEADMQSLVDKGLPAWQMLADGMGTSVEQAMAKVRAGGVQGSKAFDDMMKGTSQYAGDAAEQSNNLASQWARFTQNMSKGLEPIAKDIAIILEGLNNMMEGTQSFTDGLKSAIDAAEKLADLFARILTFGLSDKIGGANNYSIYGQPAAPSGNVSSSFGLPGHAAGGTNLSGLSIIGEDGPELFDPNGGSIYPLNGGSSSLSSLGSMNNSGPVTIQIMFDSMMVAQAIAPHLAPIIRVATGRRS
jgi:tape measure domain-containing protein